MFAMLRSPGNFYGSVVMLWFLSKWHLLEMLELLTPPSPKEKKKHGVFPPRATRSESGEVWKLNHTSSSSFRFRVCLSLKGCLLLIWTFFLYFYYRRWCVKCTNNVCLVPESGNQALFPEYGKWGEKLLQREVLCSLPTSLLQEK